MFIKISLPTINFAFREISYKLMQKLTVNLIYYVPNENEAQLISFSVLDYLKNSKPYFFIERRDNLAAKVLKNPELFSLDR